MKIAISEMDISTNQNHEAVLATYFDNRLVPMLFNQTLG